MKKSLLLLMLLVGCGPQSGPVDMGGVSTFLDAGPTHQVEALAVLETTGPPEQLLESVVVWEGSWATADRPTTEAISAVLADDVDRLIASLLDIKAKRAELDKQEKEVRDALKKRLDEQRQKLQSVGFDGQPSPDPEPVNPPKKVVPKPAPVVTPLDEVTAAWHADRDVGQGTIQDLRSLASAFAAAGEALERTRPPTVGHVLSGLDIRNRVQLKDRLPRVQNWCKQFLALRLPPSNSVLTPILPAGAKVDPPPEMTATKQVLLELSGLLERVQP